MATCHACPPDDQHVPDPAIAVIERQLRARIAYRIRAELVCCDIFERSHRDGTAELISEGPHSICFWGEAAARIAEDDQHVPDHDMEAL